MSVNEARWRLAGTNQCVGSCQTLTATLNCMSPSKSYVYINKLIISYNNNCCWFELNSFIKKSSKYDYLMVLPLAPMILRIKAAMSLQRFDKPHGPLQNHRHRRDYWRWCLDGQACLRWAWWWVEADWKRERQLPESGWRRAARAHCCSTASPHPSGWTDRRPPAPCCEFPPDRMGNLDLPNPTSHAHQHLQVLTLTLYHKSHQFRQLANELQPS